MLDRRRRAPGLSEIAADATMFAASADDDIEGNFYLAQIFVKCAAKILQTRVVQRLQDDIYVTGQRTQNRMPREATFLD